MPFAPVPRPTERAVSPVIGVILMVAITVILAATIGTLVFGLTPTEETTAPLASVTIDGESGADNITIVHDGGEPVDLTECTILANGQSAIATAGMNQTLRSGERAPIELDEPIDPGEVVLRHDPSGDILTRHTVE